MRVLLLGGTAEARTLAAQLLADGVDAITSLAGAVEGPRLPVGKVRIGGFGGIDGLVRYIRENEITSVIDATHPFATQMTANAVAACQLTGIPLERITRPSWANHPNASDWHWVNSLDEARIVAEQLGERAFLAIGRQGVRPFLTWTDRYTLLRVIDPPEVQVPASWEVLRVRGPFTYDNELALMRDRRIDVLITKDSGGTRTAAKLDASAELGIPLVVVRRSASPPHF